MNILLYSLLIYQMIIPLLFLILTTTYANQAEEYTCPGNRFVFLSTYIIGVQTEMKKALADINPSTTKIAGVSYQDELFRTYRIEVTDFTLSYNLDDQKGKLVTKNVYRLTGASPRIDFSFNWTKTQLGTSLSGTGTGQVTSDIISFQKTLTTNKTHQLQWHLSYSEPLGITNGISLSTMDPYRASDYEILSNMLNKLKNNQSTIRDNFLKSINPKLQDILATKVETDEIMSFDKELSYSYSDYHGKTDILYNNTLMNSTLAEDGLYLLFSQMIQDDQYFQCGQVVPFQPNDPNYYGGLQQFISNSLIKSTLRYAIRNQSLDVVLTEQFWQSRAFQFFIGDLHEVMPTSTKSLPTLTEIKGKCHALDDPVFALNMKNTKSYEAKVNFNCNFEFNTTKLIDINIVVSYEITPKITTKALEIKLTGISGTPSYVENGPYKIQYKELADFMVSQTIALAKNELVFGTGYKMKYPRKYPSLWVRQNFLFLYDSSAVPRQINEK